MRGEKNLTQFSEVIEHEKTEHKKVELLEFQTIAKKLTPVIPLMRGRKILSTIYFKILSIGFVKRKFWWRPYSCLAAAQKHLRGPPRLSEEIFVDKCVLLVWHILFQRIGVV
ncbi:MAG: hypothetical protein A2504_10460 [Bdellovibrionales bacterium RIFOXYD12_FULL_39_22]|nr:MAG: hypothetical protein A2385_17075 [Bdellovibrionales bacterium RIFOXYB1_FULL_39_21]OFZ44098.1 MAG: hypothetical protein A2485_14165 [Bdellovibrionales bacterium RIFOXYC12_FULL_39_17]OFZ48668.1 MAG: hypothetical protein A2404_08280 [Bdellovibrionales bacterium RIFOXYC1_FULL_39_130]OFZ76782.1 MAG: hypothetical protein A2560_10570 [Bdellovibrionales bacterium RIFOXYD1_FULL_39_84]OFZ95085.1 MAG: hypothetical protein A2504_10460 [Bdellovibrionales bacterium RIFOXYD12_FULL_39_22]